MNNTTASCVGLAILDFYAPWCVQCEQQRAVLASVGLVATGAVAWHRVDIESDPVTTARFAVDSIPTLVIVQDGNERTRLVGMQPPEVIVRTLDDLL